MDVKIHDIGEQEQGYEQMIAIKKYVDAHGKNITVGSIVTYIIVLENISQVNLESVCVIEDIIGGGVYKLNTLKINGITPFGGDIDLNKEAVIPVGIIKSKHCKGQSNSKIVITFDVIIADIPQQYPITNFARVVYKYYIKNTVFTGLETSNKVSMPFKIQSKNSEFMLDIGNKTECGKGYGDTVKLRVKLNPSEPIEDVIIHDYLNTKLELISAKIKINGYLKNLKLDDEENIYLGFIDKDENVEVLIDAKIKEKDYSDILNEKSEYAFIVNKACISYTNCKNNMHIYGKTNDVYIYIYSAAINSSKYADKEIVDIGDTVIYNIKLKHSGSTLIEKIAVVDELPESIQYIPGSAYIIYGQNEIRSRIEFDQNTSEIKIPILDLGEELILSYRVKVIKEPNNENKQILNNTYLTYSYLRYPELENRIEKYHMVKSELIENTQPIYIKSTEVVDMPQNEEKLNPLGLKINPIYFEIEDEDEYEYEYEEEYEKIDNEIPAINEYPELQIDNEKFNLDTDIETENVICETIETSDRIEYSYISGDNIINSVDDNTNKEVRTIIDNKLEFNTYVSPQNICLGRPILYTIEIKNKLGTIANNIVLQNTIPDGTNFIPNSFTLNFKPLMVANNCITSGNLAYGINIGTLQPQETLTIQYQATIDCRRYPNPIKNTFNISYLNEDNIVQEFILDEEIVVDSDYDCINCSENNNCNSNYNYIRNNNNNQISKQNIKQYIEQDTKQESKQISKQNNGFNSKNSINLNELDLYYDNHSQKLSRRKLNRIAKANKNNID